MHPLLIGVFSLVLALRLASLAISRRNERALREAGAREFGAVNSTVLAILHAAFYIGAFGEAWVRGTQPDLASGIGVSLVGLAMLALVLVIRELGPLWTVRLYIAPDHEVRRSGLFRAVRHPNYVLNVIPELVGLGLAMHAWFVMATVGPVYLVSLAVRIRREERVMREYVPGY